MVLAVINSGSDNQELSQFMHLLMFWWPYFQPCIEILRQCTYCSAS